MKLREPVLSECEALSELCMRSKAYWGYDADFMEACRDELAISENSLRSLNVIVAERNSVICGLAQFDPMPPDGTLDKLFVAPEAMGCGVGRLLFDWAVATAKKLGITNFSIDGDPNAVSFYLKMGAYQSGVSPSGSIPGRNLPQFRYIVDTAS